MQKDAEPEGELDIAELMNRLSFHDIHHRLVPEMLSPEGNFTPSIANEMHAVWGKEPYQFQSDSIDMVLRMSLPPEHQQHLPPGALTVVQQTSRGKSAITRCAGSILRGVILTVVPLLSIGADQVSIIEKQASEINQLGQRTGSVVSFHLDKVKQAATKRSLAAALLNLSKDTLTTVFLFASPQAILKKEWETVLEMTAKNLIRLFCLDEVHLYVNFGLTFRQDFVKLKNVLFKWIRTRPLSHGPNLLLKVPVVLMTATWDLELARVFELMTGAHPKQDLFIWANAEGMQRRQLSIKMVPAQKKANKLKEQCQELLEGSQNRKAIIYSNSRRAVGKIAASINDFLNREDLPGNTVEIDGELFPEQKFFYIRLFTETDTGTSGDANDGFKPRILSANVSTWNSRG